MQPYPTGTQMPQLEKLPVPSQVTNAVRAMYAGAGASVVGAVSPVAVPVKAWWPVIWLCGLAAVIFLWQRASAAFFKGTVE